MPNKLTLLDKIIPAYSSRARSMEMDRMIDSDDFFPDGYNAVQDLILRQSSTL